MLFQLQTLLYCLFYIVNASDFEETDESEVFKPKDIDEMLENEDIKNTWKVEYLRMCANKKRTYAISSIKQPYNHCFLKVIGYEHLGVEILSRKPVILRIVQFVSQNYLVQIEEYFQQSNEIENQRVEGLEYSPGHHGRRAEGLWIEHDKPIIRPLYKRIQTITRVNPAMGEEFLVLKYDKFGHYAIHYDHLDPMPVEYDDGWFEFYGNRLATALLLVKTASKGGCTVFPKLNLTIQPEKGDLILWFNADSNDKKEMDALHAACPIQQGDKMAVSLWIRGNFQDSLKCSLENASYEPEQLLRDNPLEWTEIPEKLRERPKIPSWIFN